MKNQKELSILHKETLEELSKLTEITKEIWHNSVNGVMIEKLTREEVYQLIYCSPKNTFFITGTL